MLKTTAGLDKHIGLRLKMRRILLDMTQDDLARKLDVTFQQIQKYEKATNRISASRLYEIAKALNTNIDYFFEGYNIEHTIKENTCNHENYIDTLPKKEILNNNDIIRTLINMPASDNKKKIFNLLKQEFINI